MKGFVLAAIVPIAALLTACGGSRERAGEQATAAPAGASVALAHVPLAVDSGSLVVHCGRLIDGLASQPKSNVTVVILKGRIASVEAGRAAHDGLPVLDLPDHTCLPGLLDLHTHVTETPDDTGDMSVYLRRTPEEQARISSEHAQATLLAGFTTIRNVGNYHAWTDRDLRDAINRGEVIGPRVLASGFYLTTLRGGGDLYDPKHPEIASRAEFHQGVAKGAAAFRAKAQQAVDGGADLIKVIASGAVLAYGGVPGAPEMSQDEIAAIVDVAHRGGVKVAAHAHGARSIKESILAGVDTIEHASLIDEEGIRLAKERNVFLCMDVYNGDYIDTEGRKAGWPEEFLRKNTETTEAQRRAFTRAVALGAPIAYATDAGVFPHGLNARQFPIMVARGMTPMQAIQSATSVAARAIGWEDRVGAIEPGRFGDLIAVRDDPLHDVTALQNVDVVIRGGLAFKLPDP